MRSIVRAALLVCTVENTRLPISASVSVTATDTLGNAGTDGSTNELTVDTTAPIVTVTGLTTADNTPQLTGTVNDPTATVDDDELLRLASDGNLEFGEAGVVASVTADELAAIAAGDGPDGVSAASVVAAHPGIATLRPLGFDL